MLLRLIEQVDVPARESGVLASIQVVEGQLIEEGAAVAQIDDAEARIVEEHAQAELEIARAKAANTVNVRFAQKSVEVAQAELRRSTESNERYPKSISESEMDRLRLIVEKARLEVEQSEHEFSIAGFSQRGQGERISGRPTEGQRSTRSPRRWRALWSQVHRHRGEWVKPGDVVVRILRLDRLRAEGFVKMEHWSDDLQGRPVRVLGRPAQGPGRGVSRKDRVCRSGDRSGQRPSARVGRGREPRAATPPGHESPHDRREEAAGMSSVCDTFASATARRLPLRMRPDLVIVPQILQFGSLLARQGSAGVAVFPPRRRGARDPEDA